MPFFNEVIFIHDAYLNSLFDFLFFKSMIIHQLNLWTQFDFGLLAISFYMNMYLVDARPNRKRISVQISSIK